MNLHLGCIRFLENLAFRALRLAERALYSRREELRASVRAFWAITWFEWRTG